MIIGNMFFFFFLKIQIISVNYIFCDTFSDNSILHKQLVPSKTLELEVRSFSNGFKTSH